MILKSMMWYVARGSISTRGHKRFIGVTTWNKPGVNSYNVFICPCISNKDACSQEVKCCWCQLVLCCMPLGRH